MGKSCCSGALRGDDWVERPTTHGIEIKPVSVIDSNNRTEITLNGWDFGGQRVYRPTHQLFLVPQPSIWWFGSRGKAPNRALSKNGLH